MPEIPAHVPDERLGRLGHAPGAGDREPRRHNDSALFNDRGFPVPIRIADDLFGPEQDGVLPNTVIIIVTTAPRDAVVSALVATARRWMRITDTGDEISGDDDLERELERLRDAQGREEWDVPYTPNTVGPVILGQLGPEIHADCKDGMTPEMANAVLRALREELARFGVHDAEVRSDGPSSASDRVLAEWW